MVSRSTEIQKEAFSITTRVLGLNISSKKSIAVYGDMNGFIYERSQAEIPVEAPFLDAFEAICSQADKLLKICRAQGLRSPEVISLSVSGSVDRLKGVIVAPADLPNWVNEQLKGRLSVRYNLPVFIEHHSSAAALAEFYFGAGIGVSDMIYLDLEPVISAGIIVGGSVYHGANDAAGEIGRIRMADQGPSGFGQPGSLTGFASGFGIAELASLRYPHIWQIPPDPYEFVRAANAGEPGTQAVLQEAADYLGKALLWLIFILDPELVVIGHPGDVLGEGLLSPLRETVLRYGGGEARLLPRLCGSKLSVKLDDTAAIMAVVDWFKRR